MQGGVKGVGRSAAGGTQVKLEWHNGLISQIKRNFFLKRSAKPEPFIDTLTELLFGSSDKKSEKKKLKKGGGKKRPPPSPVYKRPQTPLGSYNAPVVAAAAGRPQSGENFEKKSNFPHDRND